MKAMTIYWYVLENLEAWGNAGIHGGKIAAGCGRVVFLNMGLGSVIWA